MSVSELEIRDESLVSITWRCDRAGDLLYRY